MQKKSMRIAPVVIWFDPEKMGENIASENIKTYSERFLHVIIVDNSANNHMMLCSEITNAVYIPNYENKGVAAALNTGCQKALEMGFDWVLTMDQDSRWNDAENLSRYLMQAGQLFSEEEKNVSFSPNMKRGDKAPKKSDVEFENVQIAWTSGNLIKLDAWKDIGEFNEMLFVDEVDHEFCYRLRAAGYNIIKVNNAFMNHKIGRHKGLRMYYIVRNVLYMKKHWPTFWMYYKRKSYLRNLFLKKAAGLKITDLFYMYEGIRDARNNKFGKYRH